MQKKVEKFQKIIMKAFQDELQAIDPQLQSILIEDMFTVFNNRLKVFKQIQNKKGLESEKVNLVNDPKWLTEDLKELFTYDVKALKNGFRITRLEPK
jgi:hypothetical protein